MAFRIGRHRDHWRSVAAAVATIAALATQPAAAMQSAPAAIVRAGDAVAEVNRMLAALGDTDRLSAAPSVALETQGKLFWLNQGPTPDEPMEFQLGHRQYTDFEAGLTYVALDIAGPESSFKRSAVLRHGDGSADLLEFLALSPVAVLRQLRARPADLRLLGRNDGRTIIAGPVMNRLVELEIGAGDLPQALAYVVEDDLLGDSVRIFHYLDYAEQGGWRLPRRIRQLDAGRLVRDSAVTASAVGEAAPAWTAGLEPRPAHPPDSESGFAAEPISPGVYHLKQHGNSDYHGLGVELPDGWLVLETPLAIGDGSELRRSLSRISDKPIVYAAATHHHDDHAGGMVAFRDDSVTVLTTPGNVDYFRTMMGASRGFSAPAGRARVMALAPGQKIGPVQFLTIDASPHVDEMLLFYFPEQRILFHSDLGRFNQEGSVEPARPQTCRLWSAIDRNGLVVDKIYSGHGRPGTLDDLRRAIAMREAPCPE